MQGHVRKRATWEYILELGDWPAQRCLSCGRRVWVERRRKKVCPACGGELKETIERRQRSQCGFRTKKEAQEALTTTLGEQQHGLGVIAEKLTLAEYLKEEWLPAIASTIRPTTLASYTTHVERHIIPRLGKTQLKKLNGAAINAFYAVLGEDGKLRGETTGLAPSSVRRIHATLHRALRDAVRWGYLVRNPVDAADPPKGGAGRAEVSTWNAAQLKQFLNATKGTRLYPLWLTMALTGMRRGEALGLRWEDVDLGAGRLSIHRSLVPLDGKIIVSEPKTRRGNRLVSLDATTVAELKRLRKAQREERLVWGPGWVDTGLVFTRENGDSLHPERITRAFARAVVKAGLPAIRLHDLRHTHATLALAAGIHPKVVSERLGHATVSLTLDTYSHAVPALSEEAAGIIAALVV
ncbi:MAG: tyrosine-type recombinase/integrase [Gaiellales bacterium]|nr:tyrosine-type recombinase/integrase [Gaiellales bacterium]